MKIDGKERAFRFTIGALKKVQEKTGISPIGGGFAKIAETLDGIATLIWGGLLHQEPDLTIEAVADMIDIKDLEEIYVEVKLAFKKNLTREQAEEEVKKAVEEAEGEARPTKPARKTAGKPSRQKSAGTESGS